MLIDDMSKSLGIHRVPYATETKSGKRDLHRTLRSLVSYVDPICADTSLRARDSELIGGYVSAYYIKANDEHPVPMLMTFFYLCRLLTMRVRSYSRDPSRSFGCCRR